MQNPYRQHHYLGEYASAAAAESFLTAAGWGSPQAGMLYWDTGTTALYVHTGSAWSVITSGGVPTLSQVLGAGADANSTTITNLGAPTLPADAVTKSYVDGLVQGIDWQESVLGEEFTPPGTPSAGDRYLVVATATGAWLGQEGKIAEWSGTAWEFTAPNDGMAVWIEDDDKLKVYNGTSWVTFGATVDHSTLSNLNSTTYYHLTEAERNTVVGHTSSTTNPHSTTLDQAYDAGKTISVDAGNLLFSVAGAYDVEVDLNDCYTIGKGFVIDKTANYFKVVANSTEAQLLKLDAEMHQWEADVAGTGAYHLSRLTAFTDNVAKVHLYTVTSPYNAAILDLSIVGSTNAVYNIVNISAYSTSATGAGVIYMDAGVSGGYGQIRIGRNVMGGGWSSIDIGGTGTGSVDIQANATDGHIHLYTAKDIWIGEEPGTGAKGLHVPTTGAVHLYGSVSTGNPATIVESEAGDVYIRNLNGDHVYVGAVKATGMGGVVIAADTAWPTPTSGEIKFQDQHLTSAITLAQSTATALRAWFTASTSIVGALNELADNKVDASTYAGNPNGNVDGKIGDLCWDSTKTVMYAKTTTTGTLTGWIVI